MKTQSLLYKKSTSKTNSTADAEIFTLHGLLLLRNSWRKPVPPDPKKHARSPVLRLTLTSSVKINYSWETNPWWKLSPCCPKNHPRNPVLPLTLKSSMYLDYCWLRNRWRKLGPPDPKNHPWSQVLRLTLTSSAQIDYCEQTNRWRKMSPWVPKIIQEAHFYNWRWNLQGT